MKLKQIKANYKIAMFLYHAVDNDGTTGYIQSRTVIDTGKHESLQRILSKHQCIFIGKKEQLIFSKRLKDALNFEYRLYFEPNGVGKLIKHESFHQETISTWCEHKELTKNYKLLNDLIAWDGLPIGTKEKSTYDLIVKSYPDFEISQEELRNSSTRFKVGEDTYILIHTGVVIDSEYRSIYPTVVPLKGIYYTLNDSRISLKHILNYRIENLNL